MKYGPDEVACRAMANAADDVRMADAVKSDCLVLKVLDERTFQISIQIVLQENIQSFNYNFFMR